MFGVESFSICVMGTSVNLHFCAVCKQQTMNESLVFCQDMCHKRVVIIRKIVHFKMSSRSNEGGGNHLIAEYETREIDQSPEQRA